MILSIDVCLDPMPMRVAFLGPEGTYGERAARSLMKLEDIENPVLVACSGLRSVVEHVADGRCESAVVPVENSVEGGVTAILDALWSYSNLRIRRAVVLPIRHALLSSGSLDGISEVLSHPQALAQCSGWLACTARRVCCRARVSQPASPWARACVAARHASDRESWAHHVAVTIVQVLLKVASFTIIKVRLILLAVDVLDEL